MIVRERPSGFHLFFTMKGSILKAIRLTLLANVLLAVLVTWSHGSLFDHKLNVTALPFSLMGLPLAIFLGFRNNACYDRYWEARKMWGDVLQRCRSASRQLLTMIEPAAGAWPATGDGVQGAQGAPVNADAPGSRDALDERDDRHDRHDGDDRAQMVRRLVAFAHALRQQLRGIRDRDEEVDRWLSGTEPAHLHATANKPAALMLQMGRDVQRCRREGRIDSVLSAAIEAQLSGLTAAAAACERIKNSPIPFAYTLLLHRTAHLYCFLLPFGLVDSLRWLTPLVVGIVAYTFFGLDAVGDEIEEPFGQGPNDLPLDAICRTIEIDLLQALGEREVPPPLKPEGYLLT